MTALPSPRRAAISGGTARAEKALGSGCGRSRCWRRFSLWWELSTRIGLADGFLLSSPSAHGRRTFAALCGAAGNCAVHIGTSCSGDGGGLHRRDAAGNGGRRRPCGGRKSWPVMLDPYLVVLNALPKTALGPIFIVWMGAGMGAIVVMTLAISLIVTILSMYQGFLTTDAGEAAAHAHPGCQPAPDSVDAGVSRQPALPSSTP